VNAVLPPLAVDGPLLTVRKFSQRALTIEALVRSGSVGDHHAALMERAVRGRLNVAVSGATNTGKTTLLNALAAFIDPAERIITVEDAAELRLAQPHVARLESRPPSLEGRGEVSLRALVRNALRMRPDRIVVGEVRGPEALDMLGAMNTGHDGSLTTVHAGSPEEAIRRVETMVLMAGLDLPHAVVREHVALAIDLVVHVARSADGARRVAALAGHDRRRGRLVELDADLVEGLIQSRCPSAP
jgi:pilus assembly protein CpaF